MRTLPREILQVTDGPNIEALRVKQRYSDPISEIGEKELDYVALNYMNVEAAMFWLPRVIEYLTSRAPRDSYHFEVMLFRLSTPEFSSPLIVLATTEEKKYVTSFLTWLDAETDFLTESKLRRLDFDRAVRLWGEKQS